MKAESLSNKSETTMLENERDKIIQEVFRGYPIINRTDMVKPRSNKKDTYVSIVVKKSSSIHGPIYTTQAYYFNICKSKNYKKHVSLDEAMSHALLILTDHDRRGYTVISSQANIENKSVKSISNYMGIPLWENEKVGVSTNKSYGLSI